MGCEVKEREFWKREEEKIYRMWEEEKTWEHLWERCRDWGMEKGSWQEKVGGILGDSGEWWMRREEDERKVGRGGG